MVTRIHTVRQATMEALPGVLGFVGEACRESGVAGEAASSVRLAVEEACANVILHGYPPGAPGPLEVSFAREARRVVVTIADDAPPFDPGRAPPPDLTSEWSERQPGGLGWHLIRETMDEVHLEHGAGRGNRLRLVKHLPPHP